jgi:hypothetical protein
MLDVVCPGLEGVALFVRVAVPVVDGRNAHHLARAVIEDGREHRQLDTEPLRS